MELAEVINPHFAFPVVGVVLCAVLVFAFGFKSPVQPPSFDFADDERKSKKYARNRERSKKPSPSTQVSSTENSPTSRQSGSAHQSKQPSPKPKQKSTTETSYEKSEASSTKTKKRAATRSTTVKSAPSSVTQDKTPSPNDPHKDEQSENPGEWTAVSKKKQKKSRKESEEGEVSEYVRVTASPEVEAAPLKQRLRKKTPKSQDEDVRSNADKENTTPAQVVAPVENKIETTNNEKNTKKIAEVDGSASREDECQSAATVTVPMKSSELETDIEITPLAPAQLNKEGNSPPAKSTRTPKKKSKKSKTEAAEKAVSVTEVAPVIIPPPTPEAVTTTDMSKSSPDTDMSISSPDTEQSGSWEEAKTVKRKKVKARREN